MPCTIDMLLDESTCESEVQPSEPTPVHYSCSMLATLAYHRQLTALLKHMALYCVWTLCLDA